MWPRSECKSRPFIPGEGGKTGSTGWLLLQHCQQRNKHQHFPTCCPTMSLENAGADPVFWEQGADTIWLYKVLNNRI